MNEKILILIFVVGLPLVIVILGVVAYIIDLRAEVKHHETERDQFLLLAKNGWRVRTKYEDFQWEASDEACWRSTEEAYKRQQLLDERKFYNIPEITEPKQVDWR